MRTTRIAGRQEEAEAAAAEQSLADSAPGIALLHIERARTGLADWKPVHHLARAMTREPVQAHPDITTLFQGAPAVAYALHTAGHPAYRTALDTLDRSITDLIHNRLAAAHRRMDEGRLPAASEYDLINGLTGLGAYLLHRHHEHDLLHNVLAYVVRLTAPVRVECGTLPGWWATGSPDRRQSPRWTDGHAGLGMAHGISGPLALLPAAMRRGVTVTGHGDAIAAICSWLERWRTGEGRHTWWPEVIDGTELRTNTAADAGPHRPSWCYGTPGIARALQLAGIATHNAHRTSIAEQALLGCLTDDRQLAHLTDAGLCHGWAGLIHTARRACTDATNTSELNTATSAAARLMRRHLHNHPRPTDEGLLDGRTGVELVTSTEVSPSPSTRTTWDTCLLTS